MVNLDWLPFRLDIGNGLSELVEQMSKQVPVTIPNQVGEEVR